MRARVTDVEFTGMASNLTVDVGGTTMTVAAVDAGEGARPGDLVGLDLPATRLWIVRP